MSDNVEVKLRFVEVSRCAKRIRPLRVRAPFGVVFTDKKTAARDLYRFTPTIKFQR